MTLLAFVFAAVLLAVTPGPGIAYVVARTIAGGRREGLASCLGTGLGGFVHVAAAALGLSLTVAKSAVAFGLVKYVGAAYLVYLGIEMLRPKDHSFQLEKVQTQGARRAFVEGIVVEALNVKTALFFLAFLPQFTVAGVPLAPQMAVLGCVCVVLNTSVDLVAVLGANRLLASSAARERRSRLMMRVSGVTMVALGMLLAVTRRTT